jgi:hypothetical protein
MSLPLCRGCKHYVPLRTMAVCKAVDGQNTRTYTSPFDGVERTSYGFRPSIEEMRAPTGQCGPEAELREPGFWERFFAS